MALLGPKRANNRLKKAFWQHKSALRANFGVVMGGTGMVHKRRRLDRPVCAICSTQNAPKKGKNMLKIALLPLNSAQ